MKVRNSNLVSDDYANFMGACNTKGMVLEVSYEYSNTAKATFLGALRARLSCMEPAQFNYKVKVRRIVGSEYKMEELVSQEQSCDLACPPHSTEDDRSPDNPERCCGTGRLIHRLHGVLIKFHHSGTAGQFSIIAVLSHLIYALGSVTILKAPLDFAWCILFPCLGLDDYNKDVCSEAKKRKGSGKSTLRQKFRLLICCRREKVE
jgi:hypothetical protein